MQDVPVNLADLTCRLQTVRPRGIAFITNFYIQPSAWAAWLRRRSYWVGASDKACFLVREEPRCWRLFYWGEPEAVFRGLLDSNLYRDKPVAIDMLGKEAEVRMMSDRLADQGVPLHRILRRLIRIGPCPPQGYSALAKVELAHRQDLGAIESMLDRYFDPLVDQITDADEILEAIQQDNIRVVRNEKGQAIAFFWDERTGKTALARYWCVLPEVAHSGCALALLDDYYARTADCLRHLLWVRDDNRAARFCHQRYGYVQDGLLDLVHVIEKK